MAIDRLKAALKREGITLTHPGYEAFIAGWNTAHADAGRRTKTHNPYHSKASGYNHWKRGYESYSAGLGDALEAITERRALWAWQPFGPDPDPRSGLSFMTPGSHSRGFPVVTVSGVEKDHIRAGGRFEFRLRTTSYVLEGDEVKEVQGA